MRLLIRAQTILAPAICWLLLHLAPNSWWQNGCGSSTLFIFQVSVQGESLSRSFHRSSWMNSEWPCKLVTVVRGWNYTLWLKQQDMGVGVGGIGKVPQTS